MATLRDLLARFAHGGHPAAATLAPLSELAQLLAASRDVSKMAATVTGFAERLLDARGAALLLTSDDQAAYEIVGASGSLAGHRGRRVVPAGGGLAHDALTSGEVRVAAGPCPLFEDVTASNGAAAPLLAHGTTAGALVVADRRGGAFDAADGAFLATIAVHIAGALANARFSEMVARGKRQWEATVDALTQGIALVGADATVLRANSAFAALVGASLPSVVGRHVGRALFGETHGLDDLFEAARNGGRRPALVRRSDSLHRILRVSATATAGAADTAALVVAVEDVTDQKALEAQAIQNEKMAAVGTLVSGVAHELNNPLTSIAGLAEFLLEQPEDAVPDRDHLRVIAEEAQRAGGIVRNLLTFARKGTTAQREAVELSDVVERTLFLMGWELKLQGVTVETRLAPELPPVHGDRQQLQQVILNLMSNAAQAVAGLPPGLPRRIAVSTAAEEDQVVVRVTDSGLGIPADVLPQIFSPFFTTKPPGEGTGLGLFISYGIVTGHGGTLSADSRPGAGATFTVSLPQARPGGPVPSGGASASAPASGARRRILVVDDDPGTRRTVAALFTSEGHAVDAVGDGDAGLGLAGDANYDLVIADHRAVAGGAPFLAALEASHPGWGPRCIVSTADPQLGAAGGARGAKVLRKPFNLRDLRDAAAAAWAEAPAP